MGTLQDTIAYDVTTLNPYGTYVQYLARRQYELSNHLGNVMATFSDVKTYTGGGYTAKVLSAQNYFPFGMQMPGKYTNLSSYSSLNKYRYGFNGMEKDDEVKGQGNSYTALNWMYDPRTGRRNEPDKKRKVWESSYATLGNNPIGNVDPKGDEWYWNRETGASIYRNSTSPFYISDEGDIMRNVGSEYTSINYTSGCIVEVDYYNDIPTAVRIDDITVNNSKLKTEADIEYYHRAELNDQLGKAFAIGLGAVSASPAIIEYGATVTFTSGMGMRFLSSSVDAGSQYVVNGRDWKNINWSTVGLTFIMPKPSISNFLAISSLGTMFSASKSNGIETVTNGKVTWSKVAWNTGVGLLAGKFARSLQYGRLQLARTFMNEAKGSVNNYVQQQGTNGIGLVVRRNAPLFGLGMAAKSTAVETAADMGASNIQDASENIVR